MMKVKRHLGAAAATRGYLLCATALAVVAASASAHAEAASDTSAEANAVSEVVVTASRRGAQNVQNIPLAVDAYSGRTLERLAVQSLQDLSKVNPSLSVQSFGANQQQVIIRGISSSAGATTGIYVDEAPLQGGFNANLFGDNTPGLRLHDIDHVEVLKGPQGTLFGAGSMSGTVRAITRDPQFNTYDANMEARYAGISGGDGYFDGSAAVNIPLIKDQLAARAVIWGEDGGGYIDQTIGSTKYKNVNDEHLWGGRFKMRWEPTDRFSLVGSVNYQNTKVDGAQSWTKFVGPLDAPGGTELGPFPAYENHSPLQEPYSSTYLLGTVTGRYDLGFGSLIATSTYGHKKEWSIVDTTPSDCSYGLCAGSFAYPAAYSADGNFKDYTEELRFSSAFQGPFQLVAGVYYEHDHLDYQGTVIHADEATGIVPCKTYEDCRNAGLLQPGLGVSPVEFGNMDDFTVKQWAFYAQGDYKILPNLTATVGIRYFTAHLSDQQTTTQNIAPADTPNGFDGGYVLGEVTTPYVSGSGKSRESKTTFNFSLLWKATDDISFYARAASGFRIGGINEAAVVASQEGISVPESFQPDSLWDYEAGAKAYFFDRRLYLDLAVYHIDWSGQQEDALAGGVYNYVLNAGKSKINGVELSGTLKPVDGLTLAGAVTYVDAYLAKDLPDSVVEGGTPGRSGDRSPFVPRYTASFVADYEHPVSDAVIGYGQVAVSYRSDEYSAFEPTAPGSASNYYTRLAPYTLVNLKAGVRFDNYDVSIFADNVTNKVAEMGARTALDAVRIYTARPRMIGVRFAAHM